MAMKARATREARRPASAATDEADTKTAQFTEITQKEEIIMSPTSTAAAVTPVETSATNTVPEETASQPTASSVRGSSNDDFGNTSADDQKAPKIVHQTWERVCHAVPKCDGCEKKCGQTGVLQRCVSCTWQICKACVDAGKLEQKATSGHPAIHVMNGPAVDWSPATKAEKAAQARRKKEKKKAAAASATTMMTTEAVGQSGISTKDEAPVKSTAIRGVGLRKVMPKTSEHGGVEDEATISHIVSNESGSSRLEVDGAQSRRQSLKRQHSLSDGHSTCQPPEKYARMAGPSTLLSNNLAPIRPVMEPKPTPRLPSMNHLGYHSLQYGQQTSIGGLQPPQQTPYRPTHPPIDYGSSQYGPQHVHGRLEAFRGPQEGEEFLRHGTPAESGYATSQSVYATPRTTYHNNHALPQHSEPAHGPLAGYPSSVRYPFHAGTLGYPERDLHQHPQPPAHPTVQELASELYRDILQTHRDYPSWPLSTCLLHEVSRSWSRGALHHLAASVGPGGAGFTTLCAVTDRVSDWLDLKNNWELQEWLARERGSLARTS